MSNFPMWEIWSIANMAPLSCQILLFQTQLNILLDLRYQPSSSGPMLSLEVRSIKKPTISSTILQASHSKEKVILKYKDQCPKYYFRLSFRSVSKVQETVMFYLLHWGQTSTTTRNQETLKLDECLPSDCEYMQQGDSRWILWNNNLCPPVSDIKSSTFHHFIPKNCTC